MDEDKIIHLKFSMQIDNGSLN